MLYLTIPAIGSFPRIEIFQNDCDIIKKSKMVLAKILTIEENYDFVVKNYIELQKELFKIAIEDSLYAISGINDIYNESQETNVKVLNFLTAANLYLNQVNKNIAEIDFSYKAKVKEIKDSKKLVFSFKLLESIRDHMQHYGIPLFSVSSWKVENINHNRKVIYCTEVNLNKTLFLSDSKVRKDMPELKDMNENIPINNNINEYFEIVISIHEGVREIYEEDLKNAKTIIDKYIDDYTLLWPEMAESWQKVLGVSKMEGEGFVIEFSRNNLDLIEELQHKNYCHKEIQNRVISNTKI